MMTSAEFLRLCQEHGFPRPLSRGSRHTKNRANNNEHLDFDARIIAKLVQRSISTVRRWENGAEPCPSAVAAMKYALLLKKLRNGTATDSDLGEIDRLLAFN